jgi:formamidopyrimidine-DNA glycosylase
MHPLPELPEVQTIVDALICAGFVGKRIQKTTVLWPKTIATSDPDRFNRQVRNKTINHIGRRGKFIIFELSDDLFMAVHLRMTGRFELVRNITSPNPHVQIILNISDGRRLLFHDTRKFGRFYISKTLDTLTGNLGPEPLSDRFTAKTLAKRLNGRRRQIKPLLLDQTFLAGLGNIYVDEALWRSRIHPIRPAHGLQWAEVKSLHRAIRYVLRQGLRNAGTSLGKGLGNYSGLQKSQGKNSRFLKVFGRTGLPCQKCAEPIERLLVGQRGTHICINCQRIK